MTRGYHIVGVVVIAQLSFSRFLWWMMHYLVFQALLQSVANTRGMAAADCHAHAFGWIVKSIDGAKPTDHVAGDAQWTTSSIQPLQP